MPFDTSQYDDRSELAEYLWHNYPGLFSSDEKLAARTLSAEWKAQHADSEQTREVLLTRWSHRGNQAVDELLADGPELFRIRSAERVSIERAAEIYINRCSSCTRVVATPAAKQCLWCGHDWR